MVSLSGADVNRRRLPGLAKNLEGASSASLCSAAILAVGPTGILPVDSSQDVVPAQRSTMPVYF